MRPSPRATMGTLSRFDLESRTAAGTIVPPMQDDHAKQLRSAFSTSSPPTALPRWRPGIGPARPSSRSQLADCISSRMGQSVVAPLIRSSRIMPFVALRPRGCGIAMEGGAPDGSIGGRRICHRDQASLPRRAVYALAQSRRRRPVRMYAIRHPERVRDDPVRRIRGRDRRRRERALALSSIAGDVRLTRSAGERHQRSLAVVHVAVHLRGDARALTRFNDRRA